MSSTTNQAQGPADALAAGLSGETPLYSSWLPAGLGVNGALQGQRFRELVRQWKEATLLLSSVTDMAMHPAYQQIIGMGQAALPLLFEELRREPDHWFWALQAITGVNPVPAQDRGNLGRMTEVWLAWAGQQGL